MNPFWSSNNGETQLTIYQGDVMETLRQMDAESVHCVVTSPPYWGLRDYGTEGQIGLEKTPDEYVGKMVEVFREVRRVLRKDGTVWLVLGDTYHGGGGGNYGSGISVSSGHDQHLTNVRNRMDLDGLKPKDLLMMPARVALALQSDGWWLRSDVIWSKPNPMPESVTDRPTKAHEMVFLLTKSPRYYYDASAIREGVTETGVVQRSNGNGKPLVLVEDFGLQNAGPTGTAVGVRLAAAILQLAHGQHNLGLLPLDSQVGEKAPDGVTSPAVVGIPIMRRAAAEAARFADGDVSAKQFLHEMDRLCVTLPDCDNLKEAWRRALPCAGPFPLVDPDGDGPVAVDDSGEIGQIQLVHDAPPDKQYTIGSTGMSTRNRRTVWTIPTEPYPEAHFATYPQKLVEPCIMAGCRPLGVVLDPFLGSGTTLLVAQRLGRNGIGIELSEDYCRMAVKRIEAEHSQRRLLLEGSGT